MPNYSNDQKFDNNILFQRIDLVFTKAADWPGCQMPLETYEVLEKVMAEQGSFFETPGLVILIMEEMGFECALNENNRKRYWLVNPAD